MNAMQNFLLPNGPTGIVACAAAEARVWRSMSRFGEWTMLETFQHPEAARREKDFAADRPGRTFDSFGSGRHAMSPRQTDHEHQLLIFANAISQFINESIAASVFSNLVLIAEPKMLGLLRDGLSPNATRAVVLESSTNPANLAVDQIRAYFDLQEGHEKRRMK